LAFARSGFDGIRYLVSHDPAQMLVGIAVFGTAMDVPRRSRSREIDAGTVANAEGDFGLRVLPTSAS